jgi:hypothetical protein
LIDSIPRSIFGAADAFDEWTRISAGGTKPSVATAFSIQVTTS